MKITHKILLMMIIGLVSFSGYGQINHEVLTPPLNPIEKNSKETTQTEEYEYYLYNERYQLVKQKKVQANRFQINTNDLPEGFYFLNVVSGEQVWKKLVERKVL